MSESLPKVAERLFSLLCGEAGVTCNRSSDEDNAGWDFVIHLSPDPRHRMPKDEQPGAETAFVQVKSTDTGSLAVKLKLSNALRMAKEPSPYFLVLVLAAPGQRRIYARHFWADEIEDTLRRVRQAEASGDRDRLNRRTLTLRLTRDEEHTNDLLDWMHATVRAVRGDYRIAKSAIADSVGYEGADRRFSVTLTGSPEEIIDWELGLKTIPTVSSMRMTRQRFGIELPDPQFDDGGIVSIEPTGRQCLVTIRHRADATSVTLAGRLYFSSFVRIPRGQRPWRADFGFLTLIWRSGELRGQLDLDFDERTSLPLLADRLTLAGWSGLNAVEATLFGAGDRAELGTLDLPENPDADEWRELASWIHTLRAMVEAHPGSDPRISIADLSRASVWLQRFHALFAGGAMRIEHPPSEDDDPTDAIIYRLRCDVGPWCFLAVVRRKTAVDTIKGGRRTVYLKAAELLEAHVLEGRWSDHMETMLPAYERHVRHMGDPKYFWDLGDLETWLEGTLAHTDD